MGFDLVQLRFYWHEVGFVKGLVLDLQELLYVHVLEHQRVVGCRYACLQNLVDVVHVFHVHAQNDLVLPAQQQMRQRVDKLQG